jgi:glutathione S-transferase
MAKANVELLRHNPLSKIPTLIAPDGIALFDSNVICEYLDSSFPPVMLFPQSGAARWQALRWNALGSGVLDALVLWRFERNRPEAKQSAEVLHTYGIKYDAWMAQLEAEISALSATAFGIGHIAMGCVFGYLDFRFTDLDWRPTHPRCAAWFSEFMRRPSAQKTVPYEGVPPPSTYEHLWPPV